MTDTTWPKDTPVIVTEPPEHDGCAVLGRTYLVECYVGPEATADTPILGETPEPYYWLKIDEHATDGLSWYAPAHAVRPLLRGV